MCRLGKLPVLVAILGLGACAPQTRTSSLPHRPGSSPVHKRERIKVGSIRLEDFFLMHQGGEALVIDARPAWIYRLAHIPGAVSLPPGEGLDGRIQAMLPQFREALGTDKALVVYCNGFLCHDARTVSRAMADEGLEVSVFGAGWKGWKNAGLPVESASQPGDDLSPQPAS